MTHFCILTLLLFLQTHVAVDSMPHRDVWDFVSTVLTLALVVLGGITFWEVRRQAIETAKAAEAAAESVKEMQKQAVLLERQAEATEKSVKAAADSVHEMQRQAAILERQTSATETAARAAMTNATAAQASAEAAVATVRQMRGSARRELRARVAVAGARRIGEARAGSYQAEITIRNFGKVTAYRCQCKVALVLRTEDCVEFPEPRVEGDEPSVALPPGGEFTMVRSLPAGTFESLQHGQVLARSHGIYIYGKVTYRDGFQSGRYTEFRLKSSGTDYSLSRFSFNKSGNSAG